MDFITEFEQFNACYPISTMKIGNLNFRYRLGGNGPQAVILLVGGLGLSDIFYKHFKAFAAHYTVLTFDYPPETNRNGALADGIAGLVKTLALGKVVLVGQSYGGLLAQVIAKRHPEITAGLVLSNTGSLYADMGEAAKNEMLAMKKGYKKIVLLTRLVPISLLRGTFLKRAEKHFTMCTSEERLFLVDLLRHMFGKLTNRHERLMVMLMADLMGEMHITKDDLGYLNHKVLLLLSHDDATFADAIKKALIGHMPNPQVRTDLCGGHLALMLRIDNYVDTVHQFIESLADQQAV